MQIQRNLFKLSHPNYISFTSARNTGAYVPAAFVPILYGYIANGGRCP